MPWFLKTADGERGPLSSSKLKECIAAGVVTERSLIRRDGQSNWIEAGSVPKLFGVDIPELPPQISQSPPAAAKTPPSQSPLVDSATSAFKKGVPVLMPESESVPTPQLAKEFAQARSRVRQLLLRLRLIDMKRSARWVLDQSRFGSGAFERLIAATILAVLFFFGILGASVATGSATETALILGGVALGTAVVTSTVLVLGPSDDGLVKLRNTVVDELDTESVRAAELKEQVAERKADEADRRAEKKAKEAKLTAKRKTEEEIRREEQEERRRRTCPYCGGQIRPSSKKCPHCHEYLDEELAREREAAMRPKANTGVAAVLSFFWPGLGQIYKGQVLAGLLWWFLIIGIYAASLALTAACCIGFLGLPVGIVLHLICIFDAASGGRS